LDWLGSLLPPASIFYALIKLVFLLATSTVQLIFAISGLIARAIIYLNHLISARNATPPAPPHREPRSESLPASSRSGLRGSGRRSPEDEVRWCGCWSPLNYRAAERLA
jgi:hypothetical protein